jgi:hypothetical protein
MTESEFENFLAMAAMQPPASEVLKGATLEAHLEEVRKFEVRLNMHFYAQALGYGPEERRRDARLAKVDIASGRRARSENHANWRQ